MRLMFQILLIIFLLRDYIDLKIINGLQIKKNHGKENYSFFINLIRFASCLNKISTWVEKMFNLVNQSLKIENLYTKKMLT